jgi:protein-S-isoprenylcysteine O-methyltransferase Ste14
MTARGLATVGLALVVFGSFAWATRRFFKIDGPGKPMADAFIRLVGCPAVLVVLFCVWRVRASFALWLVGMLAFVVSLVLFWSSIWVNRARPLRFAFCPESPTHIMRRGPYAFIRHPIYASYSLSWTASVLVSGEWWLMVVVALMAAVYYREARREELAFLCGGLREQYRDYCCQAGMFTPRPGCILGWRG